MYLAPILYVNAISLVVWDLGITWRRLSHLCERVILSKKLLSIH